MIDLDLFETSIDERSAAKLLRNQPASCRLQVPSNQEHIGRPTSGEVDDNDQVEHEDDEDEFGEANYYLHEDDDGNDNAEHKALTSLTDSGPSSASTERDSIKSSSSSDSNQDEEEEEEEGEEEEEMQVQDQQQQTAVEASADELEIDAKLIDETRAALLAKIELECEKSGVDETISRAHLDDILSQESPYTCWRYLEHRGGRVEEAVELMYTTLVWRKSKRVDEPVERELPKELWLQAPFAFSGRTKSNHEVLYVVGKNYRRPDSRLKDTVPKFSTSVLFGWDRRHRDDLDKFCIVFDVTDTGPRNIDLTFMSWLISTRDYLPARIAQVYVVGIPMLVRPIIRLIISWLPENFRRIVHCGTYQELVEANIEQDQLPLEVGGTADEATYRRAPLEAPWADQMDDFSEEAMQKAMDDCCGFHLSAERKAELRRMQLDYERRTAAALES